jgi:hypothetical protein
MEATLKFSLPVDSEDFKHANNGLNYYVALCEISSELRKIRKYGVPKDFDIEVMEANFYNILECHDIKLN